jgi:phosphoribosylamine--glycine ligase
MNILVIGSGGREHTLVWKIAQSPLVKKIYCVPGNPGIAQIAEIIPIPWKDYQGLITFAKKSKIDLTVVGPEDPLADGIVNIFTDNGLNIFGPTKAAAKLESSKIFAKNLMKKYAIPTAEYETFNNIIHARKYINQLSNFPVVVKADGLAAGKGVLICQNKEEADNALITLMQNKIFGTAGNQIIIEEFLAGEEVSIFAIADGHDYKLLSAAQDHKKIFDGDQGKNTGGMGAYAPTPLANEAFMTNAEKIIIKPTIKAMLAETIPYCGLLYFGIISTKNGPKILEYNCRFGDPETEVVLPLLKSDLVPLMMASINKNLAKESIQFNSCYAIDVVLASGGYPDEYEKGKFISGLDTLDKNILVFHAGTTLKKNQLVTNGGRVLNIVAIGEDFKKTHEFLYNNIHHISFENMHYRRDIGNRAFKYLQLNKDS